MKKISKTELEQMEKQARTNLVNSLSGIQPANLIGSKSLSGISNVAIFNSVMHIGANPALMGFIMRPISVQRDTYQNIVDTGYFSINSVDAGLYKKAHQTSARYEVSEFEACGLNEWYSESIPVPYVKESKLKIGLKLESIIPIPLNETQLVIGSVQEIILEEDVLNKDNSIQHEKLENVGVVGLDTYYSMQKMAQLTYAKPGKEPEEIN
jgi:flavin reductase (DIM6/NTAB) family NADH-FMN oxidoreductase RutF